MTCFATLIFVRLAVTQQIFLNISCVEFYTNLIKNFLKIRSKILFAPLRKVWVPLCQLSQDSETLIGIVGNLYQISSKSVIKQVKYRYYSHTFLHRVGVKLCQLSQDSETLIGIVGTPVPNFIKICN